MKVGRRCGRGQARPDDAGGRRAVELLLLHLRRDTEHTVATLLIHPENARSPALARRLGFVDNGMVQGEPSSPDI